MMQVLNKGLQCVMASFSEFTAAGGQASASLLCMNQQALQQRVSPDDEYSWNKIDDKTTNGTTVEVIDDPEGAATESVRCECCGLSEDCTPAYIRRIKEIFDGKWICDLCSEAVEEQMQRGAAKPAGMISSIFTGERGGGVDPLLHVAVQQVQQDRQTQPQALLGDGHEGYCEEELREINYLRHMLDLN
ncbi:hypothetical protein ZIOFF_074163 [Zingiber officinale]|uniref:Uncharacterized protein n=1 Tax=Zingiber officinale TaxID=94328 RepID=A0A8J5C042_ZINOF|nr:hypothetical protein ZIOFF_074163 [Zingiber officinale]